VWSARTGLAVAAVVVVQTAGAASTLPARFDRTPLSADAAAEVIRKSTVQVLAFGCNLARREGTAVVIGPDRLLTNAHVVDGSRLVDIVADGRPTAVAVSAGVASGADLAVVTTAGVESPALPLAPQDAAPRSVVRLAGYPSAPSGRREEGLVIDEDRVVDYVPGARLGEPGMVMRLSGPSRPGMSGGPVLDDTGRLAGIVFGVEVDSRRALVIPASSLRALLHGVQSAPVSC